MTRSTRPVVAVALGVLLLVVVAAVAGAPDSGTTRADADHLGPRLVLVAIVLTVAVGMGLLAFSARNPWLRGAAIVVAILLVGVIVALLETVPTASVVRPAVPVLGQPSTREIVRLTVTDAPATSADTTVIGVGPDGRVTLSTRAGLALDAGEEQALRRAFAPLGGAEQLGRIEDLPSIDDALDSAATDVPRGDVAVLLAARGDDLDVQIVTAVPVEELSESTRGRIDEVVEGLVERGYTVELREATGGSGLTGSGDHRGGSNPWSGALVDLLVAVAEMAVLAALVGLAIGAGVLLWRNLGRSGPVPRAPTPDDPVPQVPSAESAREELVAALDRALEDLPLDGDPRAVIAAAYLQMTRVLADHGVERRPSDTPMELLGRALEQLDASRAASEDLTRLLEIAMFSTRPIDGAMAARAVAALERVRDELSARPAVPVPVP